MKRYNITQKRFLDWYFEEEGTTESQEAKENIADKVIAQLFEKNVATLTTKDIFEMCNTGSIRLSFLEDYEDSEKNYDTQIIDLKDTEFQVKLIN